MLTRTHYQNAIQEQLVPNFKKGDCITLAGKIHIIIAKLQSDAENPITYSICDENLLNPKFGIPLESAELMPIEALPENIRKRAKNFM